MQVETQHPILFLSDASPKVKFPDDAGRSFVAATTGCLCFYVLSFVDGASVVTVTDEDCESVGKRMFSGRIESASGALTVTDSAAFRYLNIPVPIGSVSVDVWADDDKHPASVWIKLGAIRNV
jgi:hypothetical protein